MAAHGGASLTHADEHRCWKQMLAKENEHRHNWRDTEVKLSLPGITR